MSFLTIRLRRLITAALYAGCAGAAVFALRPMLWAESPITQPKFASTPPTDVGPFLLPPGSWSVLSVSGLEDFHLLAIDQAGPLNGAARSSLLPPGVEPLAVRTDAAGRVSAFLTDAENWTVLRHHWLGAGWVVDEFHDPKSGTRTVSIQRGSERSFAWVLPACRPDRVHLLVTVTRTEDRP
jgi:hypothetical protein